MPFDTHLLELLRAPSNECILVSARWLVGHSSAGHVLMERAELVFTGGKIEFVGWGFPGDVAVRLDFGNAVIGPGFIDLDALGDLDTTVLVFDNFPPDRVGRVWPEAYWRDGPSDTYSLDELLFQKRHALAHCLRNGITTVLPASSLLYRTWAETFDEFAGVVEIAGALGLRAYLGPAYRDRVSLRREDGSVYVTDGPDDPERALDTAVRFFNAFDGSHGGRIRGMLAPDRIEHCSRELLKRTAVSAKDLSAPMRIHACQGTRDYALTLLQHGMSPVELLAETGLLSQRTIVPHLTHVSGSRYIEHKAPDLELFADSGASVAHCPVVSARQGDALSVASYRRRGIAMGLGTDTWPPSMVENMRTGALVNRVVDASAEVLTAADMYTLATTGGADAIGRADLGRLQAGARADLTVFDLDLPHLGQIFDPIQAMIVSGRGDEFSHVFVDGRLVVADGEVAAFDSRVGHERAQALFRVLAAGLPARAPGQPRIEELIAPSFPIVEQA